MKKVIALVLALMMVLSLAVSAVAFVPVDLQPAKGADKTKLIEFVDKVTFDHTIDAYLAQQAEGGVFYLLLDQDGHALKDIVATANGSLKAEVVEYNPETMEQLPNQDWRVRIKEYDATNKVVVVRDMRDAKPEEAAVWNSLDLGSYANDYFTCKAYAAALNKEFKTTKYYVENIYNVYVVKVTLEPNYTAAFKEGSVKVTAYDTVTKKNLVAERKVISDVTIFDYEYVKSAATYDYDLVYGGEGYSDYVTYTKGYQNIDWLGGAEGHRDSGANVISTTAFRAIEGKNITVALGDGAQNDNAKYRTKCSVDIKSVAAGQKGVNFSYYTNFEDFDRDDIHAVAGENFQVKFGFYGDQVVKSKFTVNFDLGMNYFELREYFGKKVEEEDKVIFYILKDGKEIGQQPVDFMKDDVTKNVTLTIDRENETLGQYAIAVKVPAANKGETNPNTGAESIMGVVAAVAVVSVAAAAAVSLKK